MKFVFLNILIILFSGLIWAQPAYQINGTLHGFNQDTIYLGYYYGNNQYLLDTSVVDNDKFSFVGSDTLLPGVYLIVLPPDNKFFQILIPDQEGAKFSFDAKFEDIESSIRFEDSPDNTFFYENLVYISKKKEEANRINAQLENATTDEEKKDAENAMNLLTSEVLKYQNKLVYENPDALTSALIKSGFNIDIPTFEGTEKDVQTKRYLYYKKHYFDFVDLTDERLLRAPQHVLYGKIEYFLEKLTPQHPDSIIIAVDYILTKLEPALESFKFYLVKFLNEYAQSKIVGMDGVYVHLVENYYAKGKAPWVDKKQLDKIVDEAKRAKPTLVGKTAPNFKVQRRDSSDITLYEINSPYTVLIFWAHDCSHCKESMPDLKNFYEAYGPKGVEVFSICTKVGKDEPPCWDFIDERKLDVWINASDQQGGRSFIHSLYNIKSTPRVFVLDQDKKIISKGIGTEQLGEFFDIIFEADN